MNPPSAQQQSIRGSERERHFPDYYGDSFYISHVETTTVAEALNSPQKDHWFKEMENDLKLLKSGI